MSLAFDIYATETLSERTERLRALRLSGAVPEPVPVWVPEEPEPEPVASVEAARKALEPTEEEKAAFIVNCWGEGDLSTYDIVQEVKFVFDIDVTEAEVCRFLRRSGEIREPSR